MYIFFMTVLGIAVFGGSFIKLQVWRFTMTYIVMGALVISYIRYFVVKRGVFKLKMGEKNLMIFEMYGLLLVVLSTLGINRYYISDELFTSIAYIPRQAYYLLFLPAVILFQDEFYTDKLDRFVDRYGRALFWIIYIAHMVIMRKFALSVPTEMMLCWLALTTGGTRRTRGNLIRLLLLLFTPIAVGGEMTNLLIRLLYVGYFFFHKKSGGGYSNLWQLAHA